MVVNKFVQESVLKSYQCDRYGFMRPITLMNELQGLAGEHADILGAGRDVCLSKGIAWVVTHMFIDIVDMPRANEKLIYSTWPSVSGAVNRRTMRSSTKPNSVRSSTYSRLTKVSFTNWSSWYFILNGSRNSSAKALNT